MKAELRGHIAQFATVRAAQAIAGLAAAVALLCRSEMFFILLFAVWLFGHAKPPPSKDLDRYTGRGV